MRPAPDLAGFAEAQRRHRAQTGEPVWFVAEPVVTFPPGTAIDPDTNEPYDVTIAASSSVPASSSSAVCSVAHRPLRGSPEQDTAAGLGERNHVTLIADPETDVASATSFLLRGHEYKITGLRVDAPVSGGDRLLIFGKGAGS